MDIDLSTHDLDSLEQQIRFERLRRRVEYGTHAADGERYLERRDVIEESLLSDYFECVTAQALAESGEEARPE